MHIICALCGYFFSSYLHITLFVLVLELVCSKLQYYYCTIFYVFFRFFILFLLFFSSQGLPTSLLWLTPRNTLLLSTVPSEMRWTHIPVSATRKPTNKCVKIEWAVFLFKDNTLLRFFAVFFIFTPIFFVYYYVLYTVHVISVFFFRIYMYFQGSC